MHGTLIKVWPRVGAVQVCTCKQQNAVASQLFILLAGRLASHSPLLKLCGLMSPGRVPPSWLGNLSKVGAGGSMRSQRSTC